MPLAKVSFPKTQVEELMARFSRGEIGKKALNRGLRKLDQAEEKERKKKHKVH